ncbi:hypothetical protein ACFL6U_31280 [Planctomycetota bacterium]
MVSTIRTVTILILVCASLSTASELDGCWITSFYHHGDLHPVFTELKVDGTAVTGRMWKSPVKGRYENHLLMLDFPLDVPYAWNMKAVLKVSATYHSENGNITGTWDMGEGQTGFLVATKEPPLPALGKSELDGQWLLDGRITKGGVFVGEHSPLDIALRLNGDQVTGRFLGSDVHGTFRDDVLDLRFPITWWNIPFEDWIVKGKLKDGKLIGTWGWTWEKDAQHLPPIEGVFEGTKLPPAIDQ